MSSLYWLNFADECMELHHCTLKSAVSPQQGYKGVILRGSQLQFNWLWQSNFAIIMSISTTSTPSSCDNLMYSLMASTYDCICSVHLWRENKPFSKQKPWDVNPGKRAWHPLFKPDMLFCRLLPPVRFWILLDAFRAPPTGSFLAVFSNTISTVLSSFQISATSPSRVVEWYNTVWYNRAT